jgi:hypothetical protein
MMVTGVASAADLPQHSAPQPLLSPELSGPASSFSVGPSVGSDGLGVELGYRHDANFGARARAAVLSYDAHFTADQSRIKGSVDFVNGSLIADWYPFQGSLRVSAGLRLGQNRVKIRSEASNGFFQIGDGQYPAGPSAITAVTGRAEFNAVTPMLTIGYEGQPSTALPLFLSIDAGVAYMGTSKVRLTAEGPDAGLPGLKTDLRALEASAKRELNNYAVVPVLNVAAVYRF